MLRRIAPAVLATAVIAAGLTGCSSAQATTVDRGDCVSKLGSGALSDSVVVLGGFGTVPEVSIPKDTVVPATQRTIVDSASVKPGSRVVKNDSIASVNFAFYDQASGKQIFASNGFGGAQQSNEFFAITEANSNPLNEAIMCAAPGERVVLALSPEDSAPLIAQLGGASMTADGAPQTSVVAVLDVEAVSGMSVAGAPKGLPNGFPAVVTDDEGRPGVVLPPRKAPEGSTAAVRIKGSGEEITKDDQLVIQLLSVSWDGKQLVNTWQDGGPQAIGGEDVSAQQGLNFRSELTGKRVGSQVVITEGGDDARVLVVDVLAAS